MSKYTFEEKLRYNKEREKGSWFAKGYVLGATLYEEYPRSNAGHRNTIRGFIDTARDAVTAVKDKDITEYEKGIMCGYRDAANERKAKAKARTLEREQARARDKLFTY